MNAKEAFFNFSEVDPTNCVINYPILTHEVLERSRNSYGTAKVEAVKPLNVLVFV
jgi:hypothetical protein